LKELVIGRGEVGTALSEVLNCESWDIRDNTSLPSCDILHICFPYSATFVEDVKRYGDKLEPAATIIHSTVPVGTTRQCADVHSPIHGKHPNLQEGIRTFVKYVGAVDEVSQGLACKSLLRAGITVELADSPEETELSKILCTTQFGLHVVIAKEVQRECEKYGVSFEKVYERWNAHYNAGYERLGMSHVRRSVLKPMDGKLGGHCVIPNAKLLDSWLTNTLLERNETY
jgi:hypothetical protein